MPVIALVGNKGGAGKTTLCVNLAAAFAGHQPTVILDADPQQSSLQWQDIAAEDESVDVIAADADTRRWQKQFDAAMTVLIDCPPSVHSEQMQQALRIADIALVPIQPSPVDIWATVHVETEVEQALQHNPRLKALLVVNQLEPRTRLSKMIHRALAELSLPVAESAIHRRVVYRSSFLDGRTVHQVGRRGEVASAEIHDLANEIRGYL